MNHDDEFQRVREAFEKVKLDINLIRESVLANYKEDQLRDRTLRALKKEVEDLKKELKAYQKQAVSKASNGNSKAVRKAIYAHIKTGKVHYSECPYIRKSSQEDLKKYSTLKAALKDGYVRCSCIFNN